MAEQPLSSDRETALALSAPAQRAPPEMPRARRWPWSGITIVRLAVLLAAGVIVVLFATLWDRWVGLSVRQVTDDAYVRGDITPLSAHVESTDNDGILLSIVLDGRAGRSYLLALDPRTLEPRARAFLPHHAPCGFHGTFFPAVGA
jgi:Retinal pigment epithelial membrane protein